MFEALPIADNINMNVKEAKGVCQDRNNWQFDENILKGAPKFISLKRARDIDYSRPVVSKQNQMTMTGAVHDATNGTRTRLYKM